jgi:CRP-like cAMP-binding protein
MATFTGDPLHRPERHDALPLRATTASQLTFPKGRMIIRAGGGSETVYRLRTGWLARPRGLDDGRRQILAAFRPGAECDARLHGSLGTLPKS